MQLAIIMKCLLSICFFLFLPIVTMGQDISEHRWQHRLLIMVAGDNIDDDWEKQLQEFSRCENELSERRILIYQVFPTKYKITQPGKDSTWNYTDRLYDRFGNGDSVQEIILIGLDGGEKLRKRYVNCDELSAYIDRMPMRRAEIRKQ